METVMDLELSKGNKGLGFSIAGNLTKYKMSNSLSTKILNCIVLSSQ